MEVTARVEILLDPAVVRQKTRSAEHPDYNSGTFCFEYVMNREDSAGGKCAAGTFCRSRLNMAQRGELAGHQGRRACFPAPRAALTNHAE